MFYPRIILPQLKKELETPEVIVITGMRQVGKTTLLDHLFSLVKSSNKVKFDFENPLNRKIFEEEDYDAIWNNLANFGVNNQSKAYIFLDEIQHLPSIGSVVKYLRDHFDVKFVLTGSSSYYLKNLFPESMAGRKLIFEVYPLTFSEFLVFKGIPQKQLVLFSEKAISKNNILYSKLIPFYQEYLEYGGFPKVVLQQDPERKKAMLTEVFTSYYEGDVKSLADFKDTTKLRNLILLLIPRVGSRIEVAKLAASLGVSRETVYSYLSFLEKTYFIFLISKFSGSIDRQSAGTQKLFLCDVGMVNNLGKASEGQLLEQCVFQNLHLNHNLHFYNKDGGNEIDFIVDASIALEVKTSVSKRDLDHLKRRSQILNLPETYIISKEYSEEKEVILATDL
ncbi:MAG: ATP-binding protein [Candidatus Daviesbacteria bacterium]|nr:ATP-binding protein [Candidatus Daviesbacteria bacterium]